MAHLLHAVGCGKVVAPRLLMCAEHWWMVPAALRAKVWKHYRRGQENDKLPTLEYLEAARAAIKSVAEQEGRVTA
jgi:hypothetical protein